MVEFLRLELRRVKDVAMSSPSFLQKMEGQNVKVPTLKKEIWVLPLIFCYEKC